MGEGLREGQIHTKLGFEFSDYILPGQAPRTVWSNTLTVLLIGFNVGLQDVLTSSSVHLFLGHRLFTNLTETHIVLQWSALLALCPRQRMEARHEACTLNIFSLPRLNT